MTTVNDLRPFAALLLLGLGAITAHAEEASPLAPAADPDLDWTALHFDTLTLQEIQSKQVRRGTQTTPGGNDVFWSSTPKSNGSAAVTVKRSVSPFWDARIGADMSVARDNPGAFMQSRPENYQPWDKTERSTGTAWAAMTAPGVGAIWDKTAIEARVDPFAERSKVGTSLSKSLPIDNDQYTLTLQNGFNVQQQGFVPGLPGPRHTASTYEMDRSAKFSINQTGTSLIAGQTHSTADERWLGKFGAEQKLFGDINVTGTVSQTPEGVLNKSISAGFKRSW
ncbi:MAG: hypothetical protein A4S14_10785 [Proteobacteria bacterium SG_bin9]|nr:MAG: hypothetical protein A4S14_10785 [Proteobacteria bacterium SG_bin9]